MANAASSQRVPHHEHWVNHFMSSVDQDFHQPMDTADKQYARHEDPNSAEDDFTAAMRMYCGILDAEGRESSVANRIIECHNWEELAAMVDEAEKHYVKLGSRPLRRLSRTFGDHRSALNAWAGLLPRDGSFALMSGGVNLLLRATGRRSAQRERIWEALRNFLDVVADSAQSLRHFREDQELRKTAEALYVAMLRMIEACINSLVHESLLTKFKYGFSGERPASTRKLPQDTLDERCVYCDQMQKQFNKRVQALTVIKIAETATATVEIHHAARDIQDRGRRMDLQMRRVSDTVETQGDILLNIRGMLRDMLSNAEWQREAEDRTSQMTRLRVENYQLGLQHVRSLTPSEAPSEPAMKWFLWNIINVDPDRCITTCTEEKETMLRTGQSLSCAPAHVLKLYRTGRVREFLSTAASDAIFVEGIMSDPEMSRCSSMSLACAVLLDDLAGPSHVAAIHYFCGLHNNVQDPVSGGRGIARVLIGQLLCLQDFDFTFLTAEWRAALEQGSYKALLALFKPLISQLRRAVLFCVIDAVTWFEGNTRKEETDTLISELIHVAADCEHTVHLKLLITSSSRSRVFASRFQQGGHKGLVRLQLDGGDADVSMRAVRLEVARHVVRLSPSPGHSPVRHDPSIRHAMNSPDQECRDLPSFFNYM